MNAFLQAKNIFQFTECCESREFCEKPAEASALLKIPATTLQKWRSTGEHNIPFAKIGRNVRYRVKDLKAYVDRHVVGEICKHE